MKAIQFVKTAFLDDIQYRTGTIIRYLSGFFFDYVKVSVWFTLVTYDTARISFQTANYTVQYMILVAAISALYAAKKSNSITSSYLSGDLSRRLLLPYHILKVELAQTVGRVLTMICTNVLPTFLLLTLIFRPSWQIHAAAVPLSLLMIAAGLLLNWLITVQIDILCFWFKETSVIAGFSDIVYKFFSGTLLPLWFMPEQMRTVIDFMPFSKMLYYPVAYMLQMTSETLFMKNFYILLAWIGLFLITVSITWKRGVQKMETFGG